MFSEKQENGKRITICKCGDVHSEGVDPFGPVHKFYPGDKLTITF